MTLAYRTYINKVPPKPLASNRMLHEVLSLVNHYNLYHCFVHGLFYDAVSTLNYRVG
jgi:hypothetical protein